jgi:hypothetical protein
MTDAEDQQSRYRFRWTNIDMDAFVRSCRDRADILRRDASVLMRRAEQIEEEAAAWKNAMEIVQDDK